MTLISQLKTSYVIVYRCTLPHVLYTTLNPQMVDTTPVEVNSHGVAYDSGNAEAVRR